MNLDKSRGKYTWLPERVAVIGLGYVGLPLAIELGRHLNVVGFDIDETRIAELERGLDRNREVNLEQANDVGLEFTSDARVLSGADLLIVTVPTPVTPDNEPDLSALISACKLIGAQFNSASQHGSAPIIVFESTTFPGCTEEVCGPAIADASGLMQGIDFKLGYSPERTNFGDGEHTLTNVVKIVSGQDEDTLEKISGVYELVTKAGTHRAPNIKTAEAAKVIENVQRDLNIALVNELSMIFDRMDISTSDVLEAAGSKWNFMPYKPGLVGGHCIPVDPYYLTHRARQAGYDPQVILSGRHVNEQMASFIASKTLSMLSDLGVNKEQARILILGLAFKADITDARNTKVTNLVAELERAGAEVDVYDPNVHTDDWSRFPIRQITDLVSVSGFDAVVIATGHALFNDIEVSGPGSDVEGPVLVIDIPGIWSSKRLSEAGVKYWKP
ncbi:nucleotide sugar dehydrogenase [Dehalococcoides mccartyi]|nr:nucleotide sugar dehydrogenase [Dehalococcoides mccartyi]